VFWFSLELYSTDSFLNFQFSIMNFWRGNQINLWAIINSYIYNIYQYLTLDEIYYVPTRVFVIAVDVYLGKTRADIDVSKILWWQTLLKKTSVYIIYRCTRNIKKRTFKKRSFFSFHFSRVSASRERISENDGRSIHTLPITQSSAHYTVQYPPTARTHY